MERSKKSIDDIIYQECKGSMSSRPGFYSGRGVSRYDLDHKQLLKIYRGIQKEYGEEAGNNYVEMVKHLPLLTATDFLESLHSLANNDFKPSYLSEGGIVIEKNKNGEYNEIQAVCSIFGNLHRDSDREKIESERIKFDFLQCAGFNPDPVKEPGGDYSRAWFY
ncbi:MAG: hypothetical protein LBO09_03110 [Candidatus Peribacteria bacterium]|jgi:hypothetical protein|nr:hypothetical protein [Candidatus Peribacteria bacterium]